MLIRRIENEDDWLAARAVRERVFIEEQACPPEEEWDEHDWPSTSCIHLVGSVEDEVVATARWRPVRIGEDTAAKLERFAVLAEFRGRGLGREMVGATLAEARDAGHTRFVLHAQTYLEDLYRSFGFEPVGEVFEEAGIPHIRMVRK